MMRIFDRELWREVFNTLNSNKKRTMATAFGIFWGILTMVVLLSLATGIKNSMDKLTDGVSSNFAIISANPTSRPYKGHAKGRQWQIKISELENLQIAYPEIIHLTPFVNWYRGSIEHQERSSQAMFQAAKPTYFEIMKPTVVAGRLLNEMDERMKRHHCVVGEEIAQRLFDSAEQAIGQSVNINDSYYKIIGVTRPKSKGINIGGNANTAVYMPYSIVSELMGLNDIVAGLVIDVHPDYKVQTTIDAIEQHLKAKHEIAPNDKRALQVWNMAEIFEVMGGFHKSLLWFTWLVGLGTLLSAIIGVSNILLVTIKERTREFGVKRAIGATPIKIVGQIVLESVTITGLSGLFGFMLGMLLMIGVSTILAGNPKAMNGMLVQPVISFSMGIGALGIMIACGLLAALLPAYRAMHIKAIDAIREE